MLTDPLRLIAYNVARSAKTVVGLFVASKSSIVTFLNGDKASQLFEAVKADTEILTSPCVMVCKKLGAKDVYGEWAFRQS